MPDILSIVESSMLTDEIWQRGEKARTRRRPGGERWRKRCREEESASVEQVLAVISGLRG